MSLLIIGVVCLGLVALYNINKYIKTPEALFHVPEIPTFQVILSLLRGEPIDVRHKRLVKPILEKKGYAKLWRFGTWELYLTDPVHLKEIFSKNQVFLKRSNDKNFVMTLLDSFFGKFGLLISDKEVWKRSRRVINPLFKRSWSTSLFGKSGYELIDEIESLKGEPADVKDLFQRLTIDVLGRGLLDYDFQALKKGNDDVNLKLFNRVVEAMLDPLYLMLPSLDYFIPHRRKGWVELKKFRQFMTGIIEKKREENLQEGKKEDLISLMIQSNIEDEDPLSNDEILDNLATFFIAGHDTTSNTLGSTLYYLAKNTDIQEKARQSVLAIIGAHSEVVVPTIDQQKDMDYITCIIKESMRSATVLERIIRYSSEDATLSDGLFIPKGCGLTLSSWYHHHNEEYFPNSDKFDPTRFQDPHGPQSSVWMPFGGGSRLCIGMNFAMIEQRVILSMILQKYQLELGPNTKLYDKPRFPATGLIYVKDLDINFIPRV